MKNPEESENEIAVRKIIDILTDEGLGTETQLNVLRRFKLTLNKSMPTLESKIINDMDIETFFEAISLAASEESSIDSFQMEYFSFLLNLASYNERLHDKIRLELLRILKTKIIGDSLVSNLWAFLESKSLLWLDIVQEILPLSNRFLEEKTFEWVTVFADTNVTFQELNIQYFVQLSVHCCDIFQIISVILNEFVNLTEGNERVLILVSDFVSFVAQTCDEYGKEFFKLYPKNLHHIISLLMITPKMYSVLSTKVNDGFNYEEEVLELLSRAFLNDENSVLQLLTHFPQWLMYFVIYKSKTQALNI